MSDPKEALERLKARAAKEELAAGNVQGPNCRGTEWGADIIAAHRQHAADLSWLIAEREGLEREVEQWRSDNPPDYAAVRAMRARAEAAESKLSAMTAMLNRFVRDDGSTLLTVDGVNFGTALRDALALLHPTVPVEGA